MKKIELTMTYDFNGNWVDEIEGINWLTSKITQSVQYEEPIGIGWGYDLYLAECENYEDISYVSPERKRYYLETVSMINDIAYPRTWSTEKPGKVNIVDWE